MFIACMHRLSYDKGTTIGTNKFQNNTSYFTTTTEFASHCPIKTISASSLMSNRPRIDQTRVLRHCVRLKLNKAPKSRKIHRHILTDGDVTTLGVSIAQK